MIPQEEVDLLEQFEKFATTKTEAKRVFNIVCKALDHDLSAFELNSLAFFATQRGLGAKALMLIAQVQIDILKG